MKREKKGENCYFIANSVYAGWVNKMIFLDLAKQKEKLRQGLTSFVLFLIAISGTCTLCLFVLISIYRVLSRKIKKNVCKIDVIHYQSNVLVQVYRKRWEYTEFLLHVCVPFQIHTHILIILLLLTYLLDFNSPLLPLNGF